MIVRKFKQHSRRILTKYHLNRVNKKIHACIQIQKPVFKPLTGGRGIFKDGFLTIFKTGFLKDLRLLHNKGEWELKGEWGIGNSWIWVDA